MARIGQLLVRADIVSENNLARALGIQHFAGGRVGTLLLERGSIDEDSLGKTLALQHGCEYIPWRRLAEVPGAVIAALPAKFAIKHAAVPYERGENSLKLALRDPGDLRILDELFFVTGRKIIAGVSPEVRIYQALEKYYGERRTPRYAILAEKLSRPVRTAKAIANTPPPPPDFFPAPRRRPGVLPSHNDIWEEAGEPDVGEPPIIQSWTVPDQSIEQAIGGWAGSVSPGMEGLPLPEPETISWEEMPSFSGMWMPEPGSPSPAPVQPSPSRQTPPRESDRVIIYTHPVGSHGTAPTSEAPTVEPPSSPLAAPSLQGPAPPEPGEVAAAAPQVLSTPADAVPQPVAPVSSEPSAGPAPEPAPALAAASAPLAPPEPVSTRGPAPPSAAEPKISPSPASEPAFEPAKAAAPEPFSTPASQIEPAPTETSVPIAPVLPPVSASASFASMRGMPSANDFPQVASGSDRDAIAKAALEELARRFVRAAVFVSHPDLVTAWGGAGEGVSPEELRDISIPWRDPSIFLNIRLSRSFYLGPLPPLPRHESIAIAMGGWPEECLVQPIFIKERPVAFLYAEFKGEQGATPLDLAYMRELAAAASSAFVAAIRLKKREI